MNLSSSNAPKAQPAKASHGKATPEQRLAHQKAQLEKHGAFAEVVIRTTPEGTDMLNFARLWEYVLIQADRQSRGYVGKASRTDYHATKAEFEDCLNFMVQKLKSAADRHGLDLAGPTFIGRVAQRYGVAKGGAGQGANPSANSDTPATAPTPARAAEVDDVEAL
jgi:hypothetical protein